MCQLGLFRRRWGLIVGGGRPAFPPCLPACGFQQYMHMYSFAIPSLLITSIYLRSANISVQETRNFYFYYSKNRSWIVVDSVHTIFLFSVACQILSNNTNPFRWNRSPQVDDTDVVSDVRLIQGQPPRRSRRWRWRPRRHRSSLPWHRRIPRSPPRLLPERKHPPPAAGHFGR